MSDRPTILCLASYFKGTRFLEACNEAGAKVILLTREKLAHEPWPHHALAERFLLPSLHTQPDLTYAVSYLARTRSFARIVALDEYDTLPVAMLREHLRIPGMGETTGRFFRDKLAMRVRAQERGLAVPAFVHALNQTAIQHFLDSVAAPWVLKPRTEASAMGIKLLHSPEDVWHTLEQLGDRRAYFLLEEFLPGTVFHVDGLVSNKKVQFATVSAYGRPPLNVYQDGGVFVTRTVSDSQITAPLLDWHQTLVDAFGFVDGVTHAEFIHNEADGRYYFLEVAARVGGAGIDLLVEAATGVNPWVAWAQLEVARAAGTTCTFPALDTKHAGLLVCLARQQNPDLGAFNAPEVTAHVSKPYHAGLVLASDDEDRLSTVLELYTQRFAEEFLTTRPPLDKAPE